MATSTLSAYLGFNNNNYRFNAIYSNPNTMSEKKIDKGKVAKKLHQLQKKLNRVEENESWLSKKIKPNSFIGTTSRLMTGILTGYSAYRANCEYFLDVRDIFSETISDLFSRKNKILGVVLKFTFSFIELFINNLCLFFLDI